MQKFVIIHDIVGKFVRGDVVNGNELPELERHLRQKAVRPAYDHEASLDRVTDFSERRKSHEQLNHEQAQEIHRLRKDLDNVREELAARHRVSANNQPSVQAQENFDKLIQEKDRIVSDLKIQNDSLRIKFDGKERALKTSLEEANATIAEQAKQIAALEKQLAEKPKRGRPAKESSDKECEKSEELEPAYSL